MLKEIKSFLPNRNNLRFYQLGVSYFLIELFTFCFLVNFKGNSSIFQLTPLIFGAAWAFLLVNVLYLLPQKISRIAYFCIYFFSLVYAGFQTGYHIMFSEMMWLSEFRYASEGSDYASVLLSYPIGWYIGIICLIGYGFFNIWKFPEWHSNKNKKAISLVLSVMAVFFLLLFPKVLYLQDRDYEQRSDYKRAESVEAAYENMFNVLKLYRICGIYQTAIKDIYVHDIYPLTPGYLREQQKKLVEIEDYFSARESQNENVMTGLLAGKNVLLILMESLDDWMVGTNTPTIKRLMSESINFTNFYTPVYGGIRTFNSEFCVNTGSFLSSQGGYAFDYVTNQYPHSLPNLLAEREYSSRVFHFNSPEFYSRGEFSPSMGYEEYIYYGDYLDWSAEDAAYRLEVDDQILFDNTALHDLFFCDDALKLNFIITNAAHLPYKYDNASSKFGFEKYPQYYGATGNEETDCALVKAKLLDDFFARLLLELEDHGELENTVIIGVTDHYTYGYENMDVLLQISGVEETILLEKTPCFIWSSGLEAMDVDKVLNTSDLLPTVLNLLGVESPYNYIGRDAFDESYEGYVAFSNGSWILGDVAYDSSSHKYISISGNQQVVSGEIQQEMAEKAQNFVRINNLILESDFYG